VKLTISHDFKAIERQLKTLQEDIAKKATVRALNRTVEQARTDMSREIRQTYNLSAAKVREKLFIKRARFTQGSLRIEAELSSSGPKGRRAVNIINFQARQTKKGLTAKIKKQGGRVLVAKRGFIGNKGRTAFTRVGDERLPIRPLQTIDVPQMFNAKRINSVVVRKIREKFPTIWEREVRYYTARFGK
jgi:hypothetical protein